MQLAAVEKTEIRKNLKRGSSQTEMDRVVSEWRRAGGSLTVAAAVAAAAAAPQLYYFFDKIVVNF
ncbi:MAG: hypothetical protein WCO71_09490 [Pseudomonadota bacterium]